MSGKKSKALAKELMDDLLNPEESVGESSIHLVSPDATEVEADVFDKTEASDPSLPPVLNDVEETIPMPSQVDSITNEEVRRERERASVGRFVGMRSGGATSSTEAALAQSESLRIAQTRILDLEKELERLRLQNEELGAAGETLRRRADELLAECGQIRGEMDHAASIHDQERKILAASKEALQKDVEGLRRKNDELELRISTNIQRVRVRERELENRLELVKMESSAVIRTKDESILELKRQIDQINIELNNYRLKNQELNRLSNDKQEMLRRTVKALRLALSMLEGEEESASQASKRKSK